MLCADNQGVTVLSSSSSASRCTRSISLSHPLFHKVCAPPPLVGIHSLTFLDICSLAQVTLGWLMVPCGFLCTVVISWLHVVSTGGQLYHGITPLLRTPLLLYGGAIVIETAAEPAFLLAQVFGAPTYDAPTHTDRNLAFSIVKRYRLVQPSATPYRRA